MVSVVMIHPYCDAVLKVSVDMMHPYLYCCAKGEFCHDISICVGLG